MGGRHPCPCLPHFRRYALQPRAHTHGTPTLCTAAAPQSVCRPDTILSTNTSTIDINLVGAKTKAHSRLVGAHFFSPAHIMPLLEIVRTEHTSAQVRGAGVGCEVESSCKQALFHVQRHVLSCSTLALCSCSSKQAGTWAIQ